ncbi:MAG: cell wall-binding repeat-containing protein [Lachnospiraceae bacterium]|nr:cell wall-binding repeat-containing protein [Lachnospiraceae bacterium]
MAKKLLAVLLAMAMVLGLVTVASADEELTVTDIEIAKSSDFTYIEEFDGGYWATRYYEEGGVQKEEEYFYYLEDFALNTAVIRINYSDGHSVEAKAGDKVDGQEVLYSSDQYTNPWKPDEDNYIDIYYSGHSTRLKVNLVANPVAGLEIAKASDQVLIENNGGYTSSYWHDDIEEQYYFYLYNRIFEDTVFRIIYKDGTTGEITSKDVVNGYFLQSQDNQYDNHWAKGKDNSFEVTYMGQAVKVPVTIVDSPVASIRLDKLPDKLQYVYGGEGFEFSGSDVYFEPEDIFAGAVFTAVYKDGTTKQFSFDEENRKPYDERFDGYGFTETHNGINPAVGKLKVTLEYLSASADFEVEILENPAESIEVVKLPAKTTFSGNFLPDLTGTVLRINYKDGTYKTAELNNNNVDSYYYDLDGERVSVLINNENGNVTFTYQGMNAVAEDAITMTPAKNITGIRVPRIALGTAFDPVMGGNDVVLTFEDGTSVKAEVLSQSAASWDEGTSVNARFRTSEGFFIFGGYKASENQIRINCTGGYVLILDLDAIEGDLSVEERVENVFGTKDIVRSSGRDRYATARTTADKLKTAYGLAKFDTIIIACGTNFPDALAGSYLAAMKTAPILMVGSDGSGLADTVSYVKANLADGGRVYVLGGNSAVPASVEDSLNGYDVRRLKGSDRYITNLAILKEAGVISGGDGVLLVADAQNYADALSASALGKPILLVNKTTKKLTEEQRSFLNANFFSRVYVLGGTSAVPEEIVSELGSVCGTVSRIGGKSRYETSVNIAKEFFNNPESITVATGTNYPDGLTGGPLAFSLGAPLVLLQKGSNPAAEGFFDTVGPDKLLVYGGTGSVPESAVIALMS